MRKTRDLAERFWEKVDRSGDGCWEWIASRNSCGYGRFCMLLNGRKTYLQAHRASWIIANGPIAAGLAVCHRCDNPPCVRLDHLFLGTLAENNWDMHAKGRANMVKFLAAGIKANEIRKKLTPEAVRLIRAEYPQTPGAELARRFGVTNEAIYAVAKRKVWRHL